MSRLSIVQFKTLSNVREWPHFNDYTQNVLRIMEYKQVPIITSLRLEQTLKIFLI